MDKLRNTGSSGDGDSWVLGLPAQPRDGASRSHQRRTTQQRGSTSLVGSESSDLAPVHARDVLVINAGEGVGEKILSYFQVHDRLPSCFRDHSCLGMLMSAKGAISNPRMNIQGTEVEYEGQYEIHMISGTYLIPKNGPVQQPTSLQMAFRNPDGRIFGGRVIDSLIASTPIEVTVITVIRD